MLIERRSAFRRGGLVCGLLVCISLAVQSGFAQVDTGEILGTVKDQSGAVIPGAKVTVTNEGTGLSLSTTTSDVGGYVFTPLKIGTYTVTAEKPGFRKVSQAHITVNVQAHVKLDFTLVPGAVTQTVEVTAAAPLLQTQTATVGQVVNSRQINDLPLPQNNYTFVAQLVAGVTTVATGGGGRFNGTGGFVSNGLPAPLNNYILDGIDNNNDTVDFLNGTAYVNLPPLDAIQEVKIQTSNFSAQFGRAGAAVFNATIKSGTNDFHGDLWEYVRNDKLDAADFFQNVRGIRKSALRRNQFGFSFGGPIRHNKTFFFGDYEGLRIREGAFRNPTVPTAAEIASGYTNFQDRFPATNGTTTDLLGRKFSNATIFDPATTRLLTAGQVDPVSGLVAPGSGYVRDPFYTCGSLTGITNFTTSAQEACLNVLPGGRLDPNALKLLQLFPAPNTAGTNFGTGNNFAINRPQPDDNDHFDVRMDQDFSSKNQLFGRVSYSKRKAFFPGNFVGLASDAGFGGGDFNDLSFNSALSETHVFSPTMINELRYGYSRLHTISNPILVNQAGIPNQFGIQGVSQADGNYGLPRISIGGITGLGAGAFASPNTRVSDTAQLSENLTKIYGKHTFKGGFEYQSVRFPWNDPAWSRGEMDFGGYTGIPGNGKLNNGTGGVGMADLLLTPMAATVPSGVNDVGGPTSVFASNILLIDDVRHYYASYFNDDWKLTPKLTLNLGLRWEFFGQIREKYGADAIFSPGAPNGAGAEYIINAARKSTPLSPSFTSLLAKDGIGLAYSSVPGLINTPTKDFAPRTGLAYQLTPNLVLRLGYGIFYGGFQNIGGAPDPGYNYPFAVNLAFFRQSDHQPLIFPSSQNATLEASLLNADPNPASPNFRANGLNLVAFDTHWKTGYTQEWNASLQYQLTPNQTFTLQYIGNTSRHVLNGDKRNVTSEILPPGTSCCNIPGLIPFPDFGYNSDYVAPNGDAFYYAFEGTFERRFSQGFQTLVDYTYSRCMTDARNILNSFGDNIFSRAPLLPGYGIKEDYHFCGSDVPNIFHASGIWELPFGRGRRLGHSWGGVLNQALGGWNVNGIFTQQDGFPFSVGCSPSTTRQFGCDAYVVPGQDKYWHAGPHGITHFVNPLAFGEPPIATTVGQTDYRPLGGRPYQLHGPLYSDFDFALLKEFRTTENTHLEFRGEFFNLLNHPNFGNPGSLSLQNRLNFGQIYGTRGSPGAGSSREIELALKLYW